MSDEQVEIVGRFAEVTDPKDAMADEEAVEAFRRDLEKVTHPDFHTLSAGVLPDTEGLDGFLAVWLEWLDTWRTLTVETEEIRDLGDDRVLALTVARGRTMTGDVPLDARGGTIFTFRDGKLWQYRVFPVRKDALEAAALRE